MKKTENEQIGELERQEQSAINRFIAYKRDGDKRDLIQALFAIGKLAGKVEAYSNPNLVSMYNPTLVTLREEVEALLNK